ncbi:cytochrome P450 [Streptomyces sp. NPDC057877]|uniref:cytochrome P450 n=1 Tax=Streptomyces sp. NPDC057877 TaxID=3346269 RepID=UPI0036BE4757
MANEALTGTSLASDPPAHTRSRATLTENLSPRATRPEGLHHGEGRHPGHRTGGEGLLEANFVALFTRHPDQLALVREDPSLVPAASNEVLCFWAPVHAWGRRVTQDVTIEGTEIPAGAQVAILFDAGNRDPRHYGNPDAFVVERDPVDHLSFGDGPHGCAGQGLARLEAHAVIGALSRRVGRLVAGPEVRVPSNTTRSIEQLPVLEVIPA